MSRRVGGIGCDCAAGVPTRTITPSTVTNTIQTQITPNNVTAGAATVSGPRTIGSTATATRNGAVVTQVGRASGLPNDPSKANQNFTSTVTGQTQTASTTTDVNLPSVDQESRALHLLTAPGDISFKLGGLKSKVYWDLSFNTTGRERFEDVYQLRDHGTRGYRSRDGLAWLVGLQMGEIKKRGDWEIFFNYRETGIAAIDPNLNDNEAAGGALNMRGFKLSLSYAPADFVVVQATGYLFKSLDRSLSGGRATSAGGIAPYSSFNEFTLDVAIKF